MKQPDFLLFASDALLAALWGGALIVLAAFSLFMERRRVRRKHIDKVGWMPWLLLFVLCAVTGVSLLSMAIPGLMAG
ncbi:hypothetical protein [Paraurantiacibacter namhicola]|uniref:Uncharacterized protein n=1 Tax=Paraurantiacibacter namhicola TaxID=645517 RepID=A0A1C7D8A8_9SPHN|nr:hypothetical protein [Paraurantiacibacter namhicola]ANU07523.1 hypothetical protein A6F65_01216 [Paraurantiacibacter namhicola]